MPMPVYKLPDGRLLVPVRAESDDGTIGDGLMLVERDDPSYCANLRWATPAPPDLAARYTGTVDNK
jgi:hypothetical protein